MSFPNGAPRLVGCTIATRETLAAAHATARLFADQEPASPRFSILVLDGAPETGSPPSGVEWIDPLGSGIDSGRLATSPEAVFFQFLLTRRPAESVYYVASGFGPTFLTPEIRERLRSAAIVLFPRTVEAGAAAESREGVFDEKLLVLSAGEETLRFLGGWESRLAAGMPTSHWLEFASAYFPSAVIHRTPRRPAELPVLSGEIRFRPLAGTVATRSYRARAKVVAASFLKAHPEGKFFLLTVDGGASPEAIEGIEWLGPEDLATPSVFEMSLRFSPVELCCALKGSLAKTVIEREKGSRFLYLDADTRVYRRLDDLWAALDHASVLLSPHLLAEGGGAETRERERVIQECGIFNAGVFALRDCPEAHEFLSWWQEKVRYDCRQDPAAGVFYDQKWLNFAWALFPGIQAFRNKGYDVAYWNLFERRFRLGVHGIEASGDPLAVFHFSGLDLRTGSFATYRSMTAEIAEPRILEKLVREYIEVHHALGHDREILIPYSYPVFENRVSSDHVFQLLYASLSPAKSRHFGDPHRTHAGSFFAWATSEEGSTGISPYLRTLYRLRPDLQAAFGDIAGEGRLPFVEWAIRAGAAEMGHSAEELRLDRLLRP